jgi:hypothetical protein
MQPIVSYWSLPSTANGMGWMDGLGADGLGPCAPYAQADCKLHAGLTAFKVEKGTSLIIFI